MKFLSSRKNRIIILLSITILGGLACYLWANRVIYVKEVSVSGSLEQDFSKKVIALLPMGNVKAKEIEDLRDFFQQVYHMKTEILSSEDIPIHTHHKKQNRYSGQHLIQYLRTKRKKHHFRLIAFIAEDLIKIRHFDLFNFVSLGNYVAVVTIKKLKEDYYNRSQNNKLYRQRLFKVALNAYGRSFGISYCQGSEPCALHFIDNIEEIDDMPCGFCWVCNSRVVESW